jgi:hypothetical protein
MESMLLDDIGGRSAESIVEAIHNPYLRDDVAANDVEGFLKAKHFFALQSVIRAYFGILRSGAEAPCAIAKITYDDQCIIIDADINVDLLTDHIEACAHCGPG